MLSSPLDSTHGWMTSGVACHHCPWTAHTVGRRRAWYEITALGLHAWSDYVGRGMTSPPLDCTHGRKTRGMTCHHRLWEHTRSNDAGHGMPSSPLGSTNGRTASGVACHCRPWTTNTVEQSLSSHAIIALERQPRLNNVGRGMQSSPLD